MTLVRCTGCGAMLPLMEATYLPQESRAHSILCLTCQAQKEKRHIQRIMEEMKARMYEKDQP